MKKTILSVLFALAAVSLFARETYDTYPVSDACNPMYLKGMKDKPWWNDAWKFRLPVVVSESSTNAVPAYVADFEVDLGRPGMAGSVRVVTDYGEEMPCWAEEVGVNSSSSRKKGCVRSSTPTQNSNLIRLQFKTDLNALENKCFHVYFGNDKAKRVAATEEVSAAENGAFITLRNAVLTLDLDRRSARADVVRRFKVNGACSGNELALQPSRNADNAFAVVPAKRQLYFTNAVELAVSTPFMKQITVDNDVFSSTYTLYAESEHLEYAFTCKKPSENLLELRTSWAPGGGVAWDDLVYPTLIGTINTDRAQLDYRRDSGSPITHYDLGDWSGEGWFAFCDRKTGVSVGQFYCGGDVLGVGQSEWNGESGALCHNLNIRLRPGNAKAPQGEIRGAAFGTLGRSDLVRNAYRVWANPPRIFAGTAEPWRKIEVRPPDMARDFCTFQQLNVGTPVKIGSSVTPEVAAENIAAYLRRDGFNGVHFMGAGAQWWNWNPDKAVFDEICASLTNKTYGGSGKAPATWQESVVQSRNCRKLIDGLHAQGIGVYHWGSCLYQSPETCDALFTQPRTRELNFEVMGRTNVRMGFDATWCGFQGHEGPMMMQADWKNLGIKFWKWKDIGERERFLRLQDIRIEAARQFSEAVRKAGGKSLNWGCDLGLLSNDQFSLENAGDFDVVIQELMIAQLLDRNERNRFGVARMRAMFDNEPRTVWNHFWTRIAGDDVRMGNCDLPFIYGVNGFNQEGDDYRQVDNEIVTKGTDFYRFAYNTGLAAFSPKFVPVKYFNVFRDHNDHRADILEGRTGNKWMYAHGWDDTTETDGAANIWTTAPGIHADLTLNRFFTLESLKRYPMLALPHNYRLTKEQFKIVLQYVNAGGVCYAEGEKFPFAKYFTDGATKVEKSKYGFETKTLGKGKLLYSPKNPSLEKFSLHPNREFRSFLVKEIGRPEPFVVEPKYENFVDGMVRTDGKNFMVGTFALQMPGNTAAVVRVKLNLPSSQTSLYALDMRSGKRVPFDGTLEFVQRPRAVCHYLIGNDAFTAVPKHVTCRSRDYGAIRPAQLSEGAKKNLAARRNLGDFSRAFTFLMFQEPDKSGKTYANLTHMRGAFEQDLMSRLDYSAKDFAARLKLAKVLQLRALKEDVVENIFAENGDALKAFLKNGGTIMFDRTKTSPAATAFLKSVDVYDVNESASKGGAGMANLDELGKEHPLFNKPLYIYKPWAGTRMQSGRSYAKWDKAKQFAPFLIVERDREDKAKPTAMCVCQEKVLGAGKVIFQENDAAFTSWYEGVTYGENLLSYAVGMDMYEHKRKVQLLRGGFGTKVEFPATIRNGF